MNLRSFLATFKEDFKEGFNLSTKRIKLANEFSKNEFENYCNMKKSSDAKNWCWRNTIPHILGYAVGNYSHFCVFQSKLDLIDERYEILTH